MGIADVSKEIPPILLRACEEFLLNRVVVIIGNACADIFVLALRPISVCLFKKGAFSATIPVISQDKGQCCHTDKLSIGLAVQSLDKEMDMVEHQGQCQRDDSIGPRHDRKDRVIDQTIFHRVENYKLIDRALVDMLESVRGKFSFMTSHIESFGGKISQFAQLHTPLLITCVVSVGILSVVYPQYTLELKHSMPLTRSNIHTHWCTARCTSVGLNH